MAHSYTLHPVRPGNTLLNDSELSYAPQFAVGALRHLALAFSYAAGVVYRSTAAPAPTAPLGGAGT